jgi:hypothetical protein
METADTDTEHQRKCPEILIKPEKLPSLFFMKETIPGGVLQDCESLVDRPDNGDIPPIPLTSHQVKIKSSSEVSELPPLAVQRRDTEDLGWLQEIAEYNLIDQDGTGFQQQERTLERMRNREMIVIFQKKEII